MPEATLADWTRRRKAFEKVIPLYASAWALNVGGSLETLTLLQAGLQHCVNQKELSMLKSLDSDEDIEPATVITPAGKATLTPRPGQWVDDSTGLESDSMPVWRFIPPAESDDTTGLEGQAEVKPSSVVKTTTNVEDDSTGFE